MEFLTKLVSNWWGIFIICVVAVVVWILLSALLYRQFFKRFYDILLSGLALIILSPLLLVLTVIGTIQMHGNPFFVQERPGKHEKIFKLIKFRTMTCEKDKEGNLLPDEDRLTKYGKFLRSTSLDELPELWNIFIGSLSIVGPRPLLVKYLPLYSEEQRHRHDVKPGLTGLAQVNGRNAISWDDKFRYDLKYVNHITLWGDMGIIFKTVGKVFNRSGISQEGQATMEEFKGNNHAEG
jgi:lipopolysaccharide/colanic/teichoic acid biosynthesis glycosyltransferase